MTEFDLTYECYREAATLATNCLLNSKIIENSTGYPPQLAVGVIHFPRSAGNWRSERDYHLIGPIPRGSDIWQEKYNARTSVERACSEEKGSQRLADIALVPELRLLVS